MVFERGFRGRPNQVVKEEPVVAQKKPSSRTVSSGAVIPPQVKKNIQNEKRYEEPPAQVIPSQPPSPISPQQKGVNFFDAFNMATSGTTPYQARQAQQKGYMTTATPAGTLIATPQKTYEFGIETTKQAAINIALPYAGGYGIGLASGAARGYLLGKGALTGLKLFTTAEKAIGVGFGGYAAYDIGSTYQQKGFEPAALKGVQYGSSFLFMGAGYISGAGKGFKYGAQKGYEKFLGQQTKAGKIDQSTYQAALQGSRSRYSIEKQISHYPATEQPSPKFTDIQSFQKQPMLRTYFQQKLRTGKGEIFGGAASNKPQGTHDLDVMLKPKEIMYARHASRYVKAGSVEQYADIKPIVRPGKIVNEMGTIKQPSYTTKEGYNVMRFSEQFSRLSGSSLRPSHTGRLKDIPESTRMLDVVLKGRNVSPKLKSDVTTYNRSMRYFESLGERNPLVRSQVETEKLYGPSFGEKFYKFRVKTWEKITPESMKKADVMRFTKGGEQLKTNIDSFIPPSLKSSLSPSFYGGFSFSSLFSSSKSKSLSSSFTPSMSKSYLPSVSPPSKPSIVVSPPSISPPSKPPSSPPYYPPSKPPYYPPSSPIKSPYKSSKPPYYPPTYYYPPEASSYPKISGWGFGGGEKWFSSRYKFREFKIPELKL